MAKKKVKILTRENSNDPLFNVNPLKFKPLKDEITMAKLTKAKIEGIVKAYHELFPREFEKLKKSIHQKLDDIEVAEQTPGGGRPLFEIPETLHTMLMQQLEVEEIKEFRGYKGSRWFAERFKQFALT